MHKLDRTSVPAPTSLATYKHGMQTWGALAPADKDEVRTALEQMQRSRCAYCERPIARHSAHIEHFVQRDYIPGGSALTFEWTNLFWSCVREVHCGKHKDKPGIRNDYIRTHLLKPDVDDGRRFLRCNVNGVVQPRNGLSGTDKHRAEETIRVFNLNDDLLKEERKAYLKRVHASVADVLEVAADEPDLARSALEDERKNWSGGAFCSAVDDFLTL